MHAILSILVALAPVLFFLSVPTFALALWWGVRREPQTTLSRTARLVFTIGGCLGFLLDAAALAFIIGDNRPRGRFLDSIDSGLLTGVPTLFVAFLSLFTLIALGVLLAWSLTQKKPQLT
jgi:hypothetical protein